MAVTSLRSAVHSTAMKVTLGSPICMAVHCNLFDGSQVIVLAALFAVALANEAYPKYPAPAYPAPKYDYVSAATCR